jgi:N-acetylglucosaminyl-diphospho-decaprenol L-rhamnosyltransferase
VTDALDERPGVVPDADPAVAGPLTAVIVHRSQPEACVRTAHLLAGEGVGRVLVVDNGSAPADLAHVRAELPEAEVLELGRNAGFGPGANAGLVRWLADGPEAGEWALVCPHDAMPEPGCVARLVAAAAARPRAGLACAEYGDDHEPLGRPVVDRYFGAILGPTDRRPGWEPAGHPHGTLLLARRRCLEEIGLFDERYFAYCEEADLGERARRAGWEVGIVWGAVVRNPGMSSETGVPEYLMLRNSLLLVRDLFGRYPAFIRFAMAAWTTARGALGGPKTPYWDLGARLLALRDFALGRVGPPPACLVARRPPRQAPPTARVR